MDYNSREVYINGIWQSRYLEVRVNPRKFIKLWAEKEFRNLKKLYENSLPVPRPILVRYVELTTSTTTSSPASTIPLKPSTTADGNNSTTSLCCIIITNTSQEQRGDNVVHRQRGLVCASSDRSCQQTRARSVE